MTRILILTRHAKSSWNNPGLADHERPLNKRGRKSAKVIGEWLTAKGYLPDQVLSSDSTRTCETFARLALATGDVTYMSNLYHAGPGAMMDVLQQASGHTVLMLGHNPGMAEFAERLVREPPRHPRFFDYPTCATTIMRFDTDDWSKVGWSDATVLDFVIPRELLE